MTPPKVLFIHGLESRANGSKTLTLREQGLDVRAHDMHMGVYHLNRANSVLRNALRLKEMQVALSGAALLGLRGRKGALLAATAGALWLKLRKDLILSRSLAKSFEACVEIQQKAIQQEQPDIVVGSSWGGAIALELMRRGDWSGSTVLLAPALHRVWNKIGPGEDVAIARQLNGRSARTIIFHDPSDATVPFEDSVTLAQRTGFELRAVDGGGHRLMGLVNRGDLAATLRELSHL
jgi:predicted esterase YcpF (UPF0227 family)